MSCLEDSRLKTALQPASFSFQHSKTSSSLITWVCCRCPVVSWKSWLWQLINIIDRHWMSVNWWKTGTRTQNTRIWLQPNNKSFFHINQLAALLHKNSTKNSNILKMVAEEHQMGLLIAVPVYFVVLAGCSYWSHRWMERMEHDKVVDTSHGTLPWRAQVWTSHDNGWDFASLLVATQLLGCLIKWTKQDGLLFVGWRLFGVSAQLLWKTLSLQSRVWFANIYHALSAIVFGYFGTGLHLCKTSNICIHQSSVDFITDCFQSQFLRYTIVFL